MFTRLLALSRSFSETGDAAISLNIRVSYTRALLPEDDYYCAEKLTKEVLPEGITLAAGRVSMRRVLSDFLNLTSSSLKPSASKGSGIALAVCGPASIGRDMASAMATIDKENRRAVGGVEFYEEYVSFSQYLPNCTNTWVFNRAFHW